MGQEASCCGDTKKTTRSGAKLTYTGDKKLKGEGGGKKNKKNRNRDSRQVETTDRDTCKFTNVLFIRMQMIWAQQSLLYAKTTLLC